jgi:2-polyprenyl-3-methyl-5-hydroxy-6-metoxy-1,4-benzoquinol methylase
VPDAAPSTALSRLLRRLGASAEEPVDPRWYETFFGEAWLELAADHDVALTRAEVDFLVRRLELEPGDRILDMACGHGRHAIELAAMGFRVTGVDISGPSLALARERAAERGVDLELERMDMRELCADSRFAAACSFSSSFGYMPREEEDLEVLERVTRALEPGGHLLLETMNAGWLQRNFQPRARRRLANGTRVTEERSYDPATARSSATWSMVRSDGSRSELRHSMRIYSASELCGMFARAGLTVNGMWGGVDGSDPGIDRRRLILRGRKT